MNAVRLRTLQEEDIEPMARLANNRKIWKNLRDVFPYPYTKGSAERFVRIKQQEQLPFTFAITDHGAFAGVIGLEPKTDIYRKGAEIGYWVGEPFWGRGIATQAVQHLTEYALKELCLIRLEAGVFSHNVASRKVLEKCGFQQEGILRKAVFKDGDLVDEYRYGMVNEGSPDA